MVGHKQRRRRIDYQAIAKPAEFIQRHSNSPDPAA